MVSLRSKGLHVDGMRKRPAPLTDGASSFPYVAEVPADAGRYRRVSVTISCVVTATTSGAAQVESWM